jgi:hypothetical protein
MIAIDIVQENSLIVQAHDFGNQGQGDDLTVAKGRAGTRTVVMGQDGGLKEFIDGHIGVGAQILERLYHGAVSLFGAVLATAAVS